MALARSSMMFATLLLACCSRPQGRPDIAVHDAWARATVAGQSSAAAYFTLTNGGPGSDQLTAVETGIGRASLHSSSMSGGVMQMRPLDDLDVEANSTVELKPGGTHVMISGLKQPLTPGSSFELRLHFQESGDRRVSVAVRPATARMAM